MGETLPLFSTTFNRSLSVEARPERLTGDAGAVLLREILERSGMIGWLTERLSDPRRCRCWCSEVRTGAAKPEMTFNQALRTEFGRT